MRKRDKSEDKCALSARVILIATSCLGRYADRLCLLRFRDPVKLRLPGFGRRLVEVFSAEYYVFIAGLWMNQRLLAVRNVPNET